MDRLTSLSVFGRVVEAGGFSAAARRLDMSATMVSNHVQALEERLGARLLNRTTRKVSLTEVGRAYYERLVPILAELDEADRLASMQHAVPQGTLRVHCNTVLGRFLAPVVGEFLTAFPDVSVDLTVGERPVDLVEEGFDMMIRTTPLPASGLVMRQLAPWRHVLCCSPSYLEQHTPPRTVADLAEHNCLQYAFYPFGREWRLETTDGGLETVRIRGNLQTTSADALRLMAIAGHGLLMAPTFLIADDLAAGTLVQPLPGTRGVELTISAIYPHRHQLSAKVRRFIDLLAERFMAHRKWMNPPVEVMASAGGA
ncbi:MAG TPA: LysR family transcriptional regulator [Rhodopila sp.]|uniref:LysR family transcriptional regulator n=1 Tax=Rhodopila sp. TaxID=2480087 RepID=UPI002C0466BC|nr:LysR family transcriptional regulator [Rhodopila sp.]HVY15461.1 LysR family transcriptional regulator [Rhodopila sp.]